jgi:16S rRNA (cytidine1402-2'-O)-methyltransferase
VPVPGASALLAALVASGLAGGPFTFFGFLPRKGRERKTIVGAVVASPIVSVLYEAPTRLSATLDDLVKAGATERKAVVARELTKMYEELRRGTVGSLAAYYSVTPVRGEVVIVVDGAVTTPVSEDALLAHAELLRGEGLSAREILERLMSEHGAPRNVAYRLAHARPQDQ